MAPRYRRVRAKRPTDHASYSAFMGRLLKRWGERQGEDAAEPKHLAAMFAARTELDDAITRAMVRLHERGHSWSEIGRGVSEDPGEWLTKQAVAMRVTRSGITADNVDENVRSPSERPASTGRGREVPGPRGAGGLKPPAPRG